MWHKLNIPFNIGGTIGAPAKVKTELLHRWPRGSKFDDETELTEGTSERGKML
jgi:hypothetical protein